MLKEKYCIYLTFLKNTFKLHIIVVEECKLLCWLKTVNYFCNFTYVLTCYPYSLILRVTTGDKEQE